MSYLFIFIFLAFQCIAILCTPAFPGKNHRNSDQYTMPEEGRNKDVLPFFILMILPMMIVVFSGGKRKGRR
jgi:hypothetical protein